jgi:hypothetical protein
MTYEVLIDIVEVFALYLTNLQISTLFLSKWLLQI